MRIKIEASNWTQNLAEAIEGAQDGDIIELRTRSQVEMAKNAQQRMCPTKKVLFTYEVDDLGEEEDD